MIALKVGPSAPGMLELHAENASDVEAQLSTAIETVLQSATEHRTGILVTRIGAGHYVVRAHPAVPAGLGAPPSLTGGSKYQDAENFQRMRAPENK